MSDVESNHPTKDPQPALANDAWAAEVNPLNLPGPDHPIALESPASIAILGSGPMGLEAAIYGRFLGYQVAVFDRGEVAENVNDWAHVRMFTPFSMLHSRIGRSAIATQDPEHVFPNEDDLVTGQQWRDMYLLGLANTDLLRSSLRTQSEVLSVSRSRFRKHREIQSDTRTQDAFTVVWLDRESNVEQSDEFDFVIDATGSYGNSNGIGPGGAPALGERDLRRRLEDNACLQQRLFVTVPNFKQAQDHWKGKATLVLGDGFSAATSLVGLNEVLGDPAKPDGQVVWLSDKTVGPNGPLPEYPSDPLPSRDQLSRQVNRIAVNFRRESLDCLEAGFNFVSNSNVTSIQWNPAEDKFQVTVRTWVDVDWSAVEDDFAEPDDQEFRLQFDRVIINVGYRGDNELFRELQMHLCYATEGPMALATALVGSSGDCMTAVPPGVMTARTTEGRFFLLGIKSYGRLSNFLYRNGLDQVRDIFRWIVGRSDLDLNKTLKF